MVLTIGNPELQTGELSKVEGTVFNIQRYSIHDGPGIRTVVFLKGCPLQCCWCSNPESINSRPELGFIAVRCSGCQACVKACPRGAITMGDHEHPVIDRNCCDNCGKCAPECYPGALKIYGQEMTVGEVLDEVTRDSLFYKRSGGGVTVSGGEPLHQPRFLMALLQQCQSVGINTAVETCGYASSHALETMIKHTDYLFFDLKHLDPIAHRKWTSRSNRLVLRNLRLAAASGVHLTVRMPLIPSVNDTNENVKATAELVKAVGRGVEGIELMPYHRLALGKYEALGRIYRPRDLPTVDFSHAEQVRALFETLGVRCSISR